MNSSSKVDGRKDVRIYPDELQAILNTFDLNCFLKRQPYLDFQEPNVTSLNCFFCPNNSTKHRVLIYDHRRHKEAGNPKEAEPALYFFIGKMTETIVKIADNKFSALLLVFIFSSWAPNSLPEWNTNEEETKAS